MAKPWPSPVLAQRLDAVLAKVDAAASKLPPDDHLRTAHEMAENCVQRGQLTFMARRLREMQACLAAQGEPAWSEGKMCHFIVDSWPLRDALGSEICEAESNFDRLMAGRQ
jgi:hypothetical protein